MFILGITSAGFIIVALFLTIARLLFDWRFTAIQKESDQSPLFRRKVNYLRKIEQSKHIRYLLITGLLTGAAGLIFVSSFLILVNDHQKMKAENTQLTDRIEYLEQQQKQLISSIPLKNYLENGLGLEAYAWDKLADEKNGSKLQKQIESDIAQKMGHYLGSTDTVVSLAAPKTITLQLKGQTDDRASKETIKKNLDDFAKEAETVPELTDIHVRMITSIGRDKKVVYSVNYSRDKSGEAFHKKNASEQNLKNDGEKG